MVCHYKDSKHTPDENSDCRPQIRNSFVFPGKAPVKSNKESPGAGKLYTIVHTRGIHVHTCMHMHVNNLLHI